MAQQYACDLCNKTFNQKNDFDRHQKRKTPCVPLEVIKGRLTNKSTEVTDNKTILHNAFKNYLDIMRSEGITGNKALMNLSYLFVLKLIERKINDGSINFDIPGGHDYSEYEAEDEMHAKMMRIIKFNELAKTAEGDIKDNIEELWETVLSVHPATKNIYLKSKKFDITHDATFKNIITKLNDLNLSDDIYDVLGESYEEVIKDILVGKVLGQFFTQPDVKTIMVDLIDPQVNDDGSIETLCDPTMGTGGFLISYIKKIKEQASLKDVDLDWNFIKTQGLYGREIDTDTFQLANANMLISTGNVINNVSYGDSIRNPLNIKVDNVLANPPFGIKGLKYNSFNHETKELHMPIKVDNAVLLVLQSIIHMLKINGKCAIVLPNGKELFSPQLMNVRHYLMKTCDLQKIIHLPSGMFTNTSISTCIFYFVKKVEGNVALEPIITRSKTTGLETKRTYKFKTKNHATTEVEFIKYGMLSKAQTTIIKVPIANILANNYNLNFAEYQEKKDEIDYGTGIEVKTLGEVCTLNGNGKTNSRDITNTGEYPFYKAACNNPDGTHNSYDFDGKEYLLIVKSGGSAAKPISRNYGIGKVFIVNGKCAANIAVFQLIPCNINVKYLYYYMDFIQDKIQKLANYCTNNGNIDMKKLMTVKIPIPTLEKQKEIVTQCEFNDNLIKQLEEEIENNKKQAQEFIMNVLTKKEEPELQDGSGGGKPVAVVSDSEDEEKPEPVIVKKKSSKNNKAAAISDSEDEE